MDDHDLILQIINEEHLSYENRIKEESCANRIKEIFNSTKERIHTRIKMLKDGNRPSALKLVFRNGTCKAYLTGEVIEGDGHARIEVALIDETAGKVVESGPEASASVEIVVLKRDFDHSEADGWTFDEFNENIVGDIPGKMPFLAGNVLLKLQRGICVLENIKFRNHTSKVKPPVFRLGARVVRVSGEVRIREAKTNSFTVKDYRYRYNQKHPTPALSDKVWRLYNIGKGGEIDKRLKENNIYTVEDFLIRLLRDSDGLKKIVNLGTSKWEHTVSHAARACRGGKMYYYENSQQRGIAFNVHGEVKGLYFKYSAVSMSSGNHKADVSELLASAYKDWDDTVVPFDDEISLQQHLSSLIPSSQIMIIPAAVTTLPTEAAACVENDVLANTFDNMEITHEPSPGETSPENSLLDEEPLFFEFVDVDALFAGLHDTHKRFFTEVPKRGDVPPKRWRKLYSVLSIFFSMRTIQGNHISKKRKIV